MKSISFQAQPIVCKPREARNAQAWREIAYFLCAQQNPGLRFLGTSDRPAHGAASKRSAAAAGAGPRMIPDGNHGDNTSLALAAE